MSEDELEQSENPALIQLQSLGWQYVEGKLLSPKSGERGSHGDVVLIKRLNAAIKRINPWISEDNLNKVSRDLVRLNCTSLMEYNQKIYNKLTQYQSVEQDLGKGRKGQTVKIIDFDKIENNEFLCVNQFEIDGAESIRPDIICFVNGLPLAVIECKSPYKKTSSSPIAEAVDQLRRYANLRKENTNNADEGAEKLFWYNQLMVASSRDHAKVGTISADMRYYSDWKDAYPLTDADLSGEHTTAQQRLLAGMFEVSRFLDMLQNFTLFETENKKTVKKIARYQQFRAVNKIIAHLKQGQSREEKSGVIWHTQGSGKSLTMVMLAMKIRRDAELKKYKLVFVTDRTQLDSQLSATFKRVQKETVYKANSVRELKTLLAKDASDLITAMVQKFQDIEQEEGFSDLNTSEKIIVLADEAHRTHFGGLALTLNTALPNAPKIGFTGTPLTKENKMEKAFGDYIDKYKINEAVADGATVSILYEGRAVNTELSEDDLEESFEYYFSDRSREEKNEIKRQYGIEKAVLEAPNRVQTVCEDLLIHYQERIQKDGFKAMIVTGSRHAAVLYKQTLDKLGAPPSAVIISGDHNDPPELKHYTDKAAQKTAIENFKAPLKENDLSFLIVKDMLLTGFDAPIAQVMYIDRKLQGHTLMQAIARVNRTAKGKECGFIVDYYGLSQYLIDALRIFSDDDIEGSYHALADEVHKLDALRTAAMAYFKELDTNNIDDCIFILKDEAIRGQFMQTYKQFAKQMNIVLPNKAAAPFKKDLLFLGKVFHGAKNRYREHTFLLDDAGAKVRELVDEYIISTGVDPKIPPTDLLADNFKEQLGKINSQRAQASEIENAIEHHITIKLDEHPEYYKSLSLKLREIIEKTADSWENQVDALLALREEMETQRQQTAQDLGLSELEHAFYSILKAEIDKIEVVVTEEKVKALTKFLVEELEKVTKIVDFFMKEDEIKGVKRTIKRTLREQQLKDNVFIETIKERFIELAKHRLKDNEAQPY